MPGPIALKLRVLREQRGLTHKEAAELTNVSTWTLRDLESGKRPPYMPTMHRNNSGRRRGRRRAFGIRGIPYVSRSALRRL